MRAGTLAEGQRGLVRRSRPKLDLLNVQRVRLVGLVSIPRLDDRLGSSRLAGTDCTWLVVRVRMNGELVAALVGVVLGVGFVLALLIVIGVLWAEQTADDLG